MKNKIALFTVDTVGVEITHEFLEDYFDFIHIESVDDPMLSNHMIDIIVCDEYGPSKKQLCSKLDINIPVLFLTEKDHHEIDKIRQKCGRLFSYLQKPFTPDQLKVAIQQSLSKFRD